MIPRRLWSTVTTHSWSSASSGGRATAPALVTVFGITLIGMAPFTSTKRQEVRGHLVHVSSRELHGRHQRARLDRRGILYPGPQGLRSILDHPGPDRRSAH